jgi:hypothetical protein
MRLSLAEALGNVDLQPGQTYREMVNGRTIEVRVLDDAPTPTFADQVMLEPWVDFPFKPAGTLRARPGTLPLPDPPVIPLDEEDTE